MSMQKGRGLMKILILTARCGMGHYKSAEIIQDQVKKERPDAEVKVVDIYQALYQRHYEQIYHFYDFLVHHAKPVYNVFYKMGVEKKGKPSLVGQLFFKGFSELLEEEDPDVVISTYSLTSQQVAQYKRETGSQLFLVTWITDIEPHQTWVNPGTNLYVAADDWTKKELVKMGVEAQSIRIGGIPVADNFVHNNPDKGQSRDNKKKILVMGGGLGLLPTNPEFYDRLNGLAEVQVIVVCGTNRKLYQKLKANYPSFQVLAYVDNVADLMEEADILMTKPGGVSLFEAIQSGLPLVVFSPDLEQEKYNARYIERKGIGMVLSKKRKAYRGNTEALAALLDDEDRLRTMRKNMAGIRNGIQPVSFYSFV